MTATGYGIAFYYGLTGFACFWYFRRELRRARGTSSSSGSMPLLGGLILFGMLGYDVDLGANPSNSNVGPRVARGRAASGDRGVGLALGIVLMIVQRLASADPFFRRRREVAEPGILEKVAAGG